MDDDTTKAKQSYSTMTVGKAQERVGIKIDLLYHNAIPVKTMLDGAQYTLEGLDPDVISKTKEPCTRCSFDMLQWKAIQAILSAILNPMSKT